MEEIYCFAGNPLDRVSQRRPDAGWVASLLADPATRVLPLHGLKPPVRHSSAAALDWQTVGPWQSLIDTGSTLILLGIHDGRAFFALDAGSTEVTSDNGSVVMDARAAAPMIDGGEAAILAEARSLIDWHDRHRFCARCGTPSVVASGGWVRHCPNCKAHHFPRVDPVVIMLAIRGERCLLGRGHRRPGRPVFVPRRLHGAGRNAGRGGAARSTRGIGYSGRKREVSRLAALALSVEPDDGFSRRSVDRGDHDRSRGARRGALVRARRSPRNGRTVANGRPDPGLATLPPPLAIGHQIARRWAFGLDGV